MNGITVYNTTVVVSYICIQVKQLSISTGVRSVKVYNCTRMWLFNDKYKFVEIEISASACIAFSESLK
jgi:hypothetical protein